MDKENSEELMENRYIEDRQVENRCIEDRQVKNRQVDRWVG